MESRRKRTPPTSAKCGKQPLRRRRPLPDGEDEDAGADAEPESVLLTQPFIKNPEVTIIGLIQQATQKFGERIELSRFVRYSVTQ